MSTDEDRVRRFRLVVNASLPVMAFFVGHVVIVCSGFFAVSVLPHTAIPAVWALVFAPLGSFALVATICAIVVWWRERERLRDREERPDPVG